MFINIKLCTLFGNDTLGAEAVKELVPALVEKLDAEEDGNMKVCIFNVAESGLLSTCAYNFQRKLHNIC